MILYDFVRILYDFVWFYTIFYDFVWFYTDRLNHQPLREHRVVEMEEAFTSFDLFDTSLPVTRCATDVNGDDDDDYLMSYMFWNGFDYDIQCCRSTWFEIWNWHCRDTIARLLRHRDFVLDLHAKSERELQSVIPPFS